MSKSKKISLFCMGEIHNCPGSPNIVLQAIEYIRAQSPSTRVIFATETHSDFTISRYSEALRTMVENSEQVEQISKSMGENYITEVSQSNMLTYMTKESFKASIDQGALNGVSYQNIFYRHNRAAKVKLLEYLRKEKIDFVPTDLAQNRFRQDVHPSELEKLRITTQAVNLKRTMIKVSEAHEDTVIFHLGGYVHCQRLAATIMQSLKSNPLSDTDVEIYPIRLISKYVSPDSLKTMNGQNNELIAKDSNAIKALYEIMPVQDIRLVEQAPGRFDFTDFRAYISAAVNKKNLDES
jgi:hypothetical protein